MKHTLTLILIFFIAAVASGQEFKGVKFGISTVNDIKTLHGNNPIAIDDNMITYSSKLGSRDVVLVFVLKNGVCTNMIYSPKGRRLSGNDHYSIYESWDNALSKKYTLFEDRTKWQESAKEIYRPSPGDALSFDMVSFTKIYESESGLYILLSSNMENSEITTALMYTTKDFWSNQTDDF